MATRDIVHLRLSGIPDRLKLHASPMWLNPVYKKAFNDSRMNPPSARVHDIWDRLILAQVPIRGHDSNVGVSIMKSRANCVSGLARPISEEL
jgi:hypothetical protein